MKGGIRLWSMDGTERMFLANQYIGILGPGKVIRHSSVNNGDSNGTNLVSKSINNSFFARFRNNEAIFSKNYHICMGVNVTRTRGDDTSSVRNSSLWICDSSPSKNLIQILSSLLLPHVISRNNKIWRISSNKWFYAW